MEAAPCAGKTRVPDWLQSLLLSHSVMKNTPEEFAFSWKAAEDMRFPVKNTRHSAGNENIYALFIATPLFIGHQSSVKMKTKYILPGIRLFDRKRVYCVRSDGSSLFQNHFRIGPYSALVYLHSVYNPFCAFLQHSTRALLPSDSHSH